MANILKSRSMLERDIIHTTTTKRETKSVRWHRENQDAYENSSPDGKSFHRIVGRRQRSFHLSGGIPSLLSLFIRIHSFVTENIISFTYYPLFILLQHIQVAFFTFIDFPFFSLSLAVFIYWKQCRVLTEFNTHRCVSSVFLTNIVDENGWNQPKCVHISHVLFATELLRFAYFDNNCEWFFIASGAHPHKYWSFFNGWWQLRENAKKSRMKQRENKIQSNKFLGKWPYEYCEKDFLYL